MGLTKALLGFDKTTIDEQLQEIKNLEKRIDDLNLEVDDFLRKYNELKTIYYHNLNLQNDKIDMLAEEIELLRQEQAGGGGSSPSPLAFPTAVGAGASITGGRGGQVIKVTNLNDSGAGSFRAAMEATGPRIIIFDVSGYIDLLSPIEMGPDQSNVTVMGHHAPQGGVCIRGFIIAIGGELGGVPNEPCDNVIIRHLKLRNGRSGGPIIYNHNLRSSGCNGMVIDHCSFSYSFNEAISLTAAQGDLQNITVQRCLFSQNATNIVAGSGEDRAYRTGKMSFYYNLYCNSMQRTPNPAGDLQYDIINNVMFNIRNRLVNVSTGDASVNFIANHILEGAESTWENRVQLGDFLGDVKISPLIYTANNYHEVLYTTPQLDDRNLWTDFWDNGPVDAQYFTTIMHPLLGEAPSIQTAVDARTDVLADVGANTHINLDGTASTYIDSYDQERIDDATNQVNREPFPANLPQPLSYPTLPTNTRSGYDTAGDGIPDTWKTANGYTVSTDYSQVIDPATGYAIIELYANEFES